jgi:hypothetical protein
LYHSALGSRVIKKKEEASTKEESRSERRRDNVTGFKDVYLKMAQAKARFLYVPYSPDNGFQISPAGLGLRGLGSGISVIGFRVEGLTGGAATTAGTAEAAPPPPNEEGIT